jgi:hypothetical protein
VAIIVCDIWYEGISDEVITLYAEEIVFAGMTIKIFKLNLLSVG